MYIYKEELENVVVHLLYSVVCVFVIHIQKERSLFVLKQHMFWNVTLHHYHFR